MDKNKLTEIQVGAFVLTSIAILAIGALWIAGSTVLSAKREPYRVLMHDSGGLKVGDRVRVAGVSVGRVRKVELRPVATHPVVLHVAINSTVKIGVDSSANVATTGLLGASYLQVDAGSPGAESLVAGGEILGSSSVGLSEALALVDEVSGRVIALLDQTAEALDTLSGDMRPLIGSVETVLSAGNLDNIREILTGLRAVTGETGPRVGSLLDRLDSAARQIEGGVEGMPELMGEMKLLVADVRRVLGPDGARLIEVLETAEGSLQTADETFAALGGNRGEIEQTLRDLRDAVSNLKAFSQQIKERPFSLVRIKPEPERRPGDAAKESNR